MRLPNLLRRYATTASSSNVLRELKARGMVAQLTSQHLYKLLENQRIALYGGVDPSAASLHVGNLAMLMTLLHFYLHGHTVIPLIGGATGRVGDPGGRNTERDLIAQDIVDHNATSITNQVEHFFRRASHFAQKRSISEEENRRLKIMNNLSWHLSLSMLSFLRFPGKLLRVNALLTRESVKTRLGSSHGISYAEFSYQLLQAYDFYILHRDHDVKLQIGGSDQWGNIVSGVELIRKSSGLHSSLGVTPSSPSSSEQPNVSESLSDPSTSQLLNPSDIDTGAPDVAYGLTIPLLTTSTGEKFGKSAGNAIWLDRKMTSVFDFYQFFMRVSDTEVLPYLRYLTLIPTQEIEQLYAEHLNTPEKRIAQQRLAAEVTEMIHGADALKGAQLASSILFSSAKSHAGFDSMDTEALLQAIGDHPRLRKVTTDEVIGIPITRVVANLGLVSSHGKAKTLLQAGGLYLNDMRVDSLDQKMEKGSFVNGRVAILRAGREEHLILEVV